MALSALNFRNPRRGKQPRANWFIRKGRELRRKRVAHARLSAAHALKRAQAEVNRVYVLARAHKVPMDAMGPIPVLPLLPGQDWIDCKRGLGELKDVVKAAPADPAPSSEPVTA